MKEKPYIIQGNLFEETVIMKGYRVRVSYVPVSEQEHRRKVMAVVRVLCNSHHKNKP